uniref:Spamprin n=1 Tax=Scylla paramamosain TaxID=85552 RepID=A0AAT9P8M0_SCYPA
MSSAHCQTRRTASSPRWSRHRGATPTSQTLTSAGPGECYNRPASLCISLFLLYGKSRRHNSEDIRCIKYENALEKEEPGRRKRMPNGSDSQMQQRH